MKKKTGFFNSSSNSTFIFDNKKRNHFLYILIDSFISFCLFTQFSSKKSREARLFPALFLDSHLWYWACRNWNSSLIRSQDSVTVNLNGCPGWCGTSTRNQRACEEEVGGGERESKNWATKVQCLDTTCRTGAFLFFLSFLFDNGPLWSHSVSSHFNPRIHTHTDTNSSRNLDNELNC